VILVNRITILHLNQEIVCEGLRGACCVQMRNHSHCERPCSPHQKLGFEVLDLRLISLQLQYDLLS